MNNIKELVVTSKEKVIGCIKEHPVASVGVAIGTFISAFLIDNHANHDAMEHGYDRKFKVGPFESGVYKDHPRIK